MSTARRLETTSARRKDFFPGRNSPEWGGRDSSAIPTNRLGRLALPGRARRAHGHCHSALSQCRKKVDQAGREGLVGIICDLALLSVLLAPRTETGAEAAACEAHVVQPNQRHIMSRRSAQESRKTPPTKFPRDGRGMRSHLRNRVNLSCPPGTQGSSKTA